MVEIVCHGLQSCLASNPIDIPFKSCFYEPGTKPRCEENSYKTNTIHHSNPNNNQSGRNFLQALSNVSKDKETTAKTYVHPQVKYSSVRLSPKSLELCTENLGNETGTNDNIDNEFDLLSSSSSSSSWECVETREKKKANQLLRAEKEKTKNFPPPLTTIRGGSDSLKMMPHREGGRLVIEVTKVQPSGSCFQAERSHGRLCLSFLKNLTEEDDNEDNGDDENEVFEEELENEMIGESTQLIELQDIYEHLSSNSDSHIVSLFSHSVKNSAYKKKEMIEEIKDMEAEEETEEEAELEGVENENNDDKRDTCENSWNIGGGIRMVEKHDRRGRRSRRRCKEGDYENNGFGIAVVKFLTA